MLSLCSTFLLSVLCSLYSQILSALSLSLFSLFSLYSVSALCSLSLSLSTLPTLSFFSLYYSLSLLSLLLLYTLSIVSPSHLSTPSPFTLSPLTFLSSTSVQPSSFLYLLLALPHKYSRIWYKHSITWENPNLVFSQSLCAFFRLVLHFRWYWQHFFMIGLPREAVEADKESCWLNWNWGNIPEHLQVVQTALPTFTCCFHIFSYFVAVVPRLFLSLSWHAPSVVLSVYLCVCRSLFALWIRDAPTGNGRRWQRQLEVALVGRTRRGGKRVSICLCQQNVFSCQHS